MNVNVWIGLSQAARDAYLAYKQGETTVMDETTYKILDRMADHAVVEPMFKTVAAAGKNYRLFSVNLDGSAKAKTAIDYINDKWGNHIIIGGVWWWDGRQVGTDWIMDAEGVPTGEVTGTPLYPINPNLYKFMPDTYDMTDPENPVAIPASSNADLTDVNIVIDSTGRQANRRFA